METAKIAQILLVEDNPADIRLTEEVLLESKVQVNLNKLMDGNEVLKYLKKEENYKDMPRPDIILLDLNLPKKNGKEILAEIKNDPSFKTIPVVVLTSSTSELDIAKSYELNANCYITKPVDLDQFIKIVRAIEQFWLSIVKLPQSTLS